MREKNMSKVFEVFKFLNKVEYTQEEIKKLIIAGYMQGYEAGHNDTVESAYTDAQESGKDWLADAEIDGGLEYTVSLIT